MAQVLLKKQITLRGSAQIVMEFFDFSINSILFQRALYPPEDFKMVKKYGLNLLLSSDEQLQGYLRNALRQIQYWIEAKVISKMVVVISSNDTKEVLERWQFNIELESSAGKENSRPKVETKSERQINNEIAAIMRQITASVSFLPELAEPCTFNILAYTEANAEVPSTWVDSDARMISSNAEQVRLKSFSTSVHKVESLVAYKLDNSL